MMLESVTVRELRAEASERLSQLGWSRAARAALDVDTVAELIDAIHDDIADDLNAEREISLQEALGSCAMLAILGDRIEQLTAMQAALAPRVSGD